MEERGQEGNRGTKHSASKRGHRGLTSTIRIRRAPRSPPWDWDGRALRLTVKWFPAASPSSALRPLLAAPGFRRRGTSSFFFSVAEEERVFYAAQARFGPISPTLSILHWTQVKFCVQNFFLGGLNFKSVDTHYTLVDLNSVFWTKALPFSIDITGKIYKIHSTSEQKSLLHKILITE